MATCHTAYKIVIVRIDVTTCVYLSQVLTPCFLSRDLSMIHLCLSAYNTQWSDLWPRDSVTDKIPNLFIPSLMVPSAIYETQDTIVLVNTGLALQEN